MGKFATKNRIISDLKLRRITAAQGKARMDASFHDGYGTDDCYRRDIIPAIKAAALTERAIDAVEPPVAIYGDTNRHHHALKDLGGRWDGTIKAWIVPASAKNLALGLSDDLTAGTALEARTEAIKKSVVSGQPEHLRSREAFRATFGRDYDHEADGCNAPWLEE